MLECQDCGDDIRPLTPAERRDIVLNPYRYVVSCTTCQRDRGTVG
jgi:hypothetical protein